MTKQVPVNKNLSKHFLKYRFPLWLTIFFFLLISIPILTFLGRLELAKIIGVSCLILVIIALRIWLRISHFNSQKVDRLVLNKNQIFELERSYPFLKKIIDSERQVIFDRSGLVLAEIKFICSDNEQFSKDEIIEFALNIAIIQMDEDYTNHFGLEIKISKFNQPNYLSLSDLPPKFMSEDFSAYKNNLQNSQFALNFNRLISST